MKTFWPAMIGILAFQGACAGSGCAPSAEPRNEFGPEEAQGAGQAITISAQSNAKTFKGAEAHALAATCHTSFPASPPDADLDSIPDVLTSLTFTNCVSGGFTLNGSGTIQDSNTSLASFAFQSTLDTVSTGTLNGDTVTYDVSTVITASQSGGTFNVTDAAVVETTVSGPLYSGRLEDSHLWATSFTPDDGTWVPASGLPLEDGDLSFSGAYEVIVDPADDSAVSTSGVSSGVVRTAASCPTSIVSGTVEILLAEPEEVVGNFLRVTWSGCGATTTTLTPF